MKSTTKPTFRSALLSILAPLAFALPVHAVGIFSLINNQPTNAIAHVILLSDGTVLGNAVGNTNWYRFTPDSSGSYKNGTWTSIASAYYARQNYASVVLQDGRLFVAGGDSGATAEIYNPTNNTWTVVSPPLILLDPTQPSPDDGGLQTIGAAECTLLPDGMVLLIPARPKNLNGSLVFNPATMSWVFGPISIYWLIDAPILKLPDNSILAVNPNSTLTERYLPSLKVWTNDASTSPVNLWAPLGTSTVVGGPAFLLPNGKAIFFGASGQTAIYTPSGGNSAGTWTQGPNIPSGSVAADAPGAMLVNGNILLATGPPPYTNGSGVAFPGPTTNYEYDYTSGVGGTFTFASNRVFVGGTVPAPPVTQMALDLPDGTVLYGIGFSPTLFENYVPGGSPLAAGQPTILSITTNSDGSLHFTGTLFNGISEGATSGLFHQMDSGFPLVRFTDASGNVRYGRTYNWSSTGVMTGTNVVSTECRPPAGWTPQDKIQVVANGIASSNVVWQPIVTNPNDSGAGSLRQAVANSVSGSTITFAAGLSGQTITLTSGELELSNGVTIDASALAGGIWVNGNHNSRIFNVAGGTTLTFNSLTITNGYVTGDSGGGIQNGGTLTLNNCTLAGNSSDFGGAINNFGTLTLLGCTLAGNAAGFGGAIENISSCSLVNCTLANNTTPANGGAIHHEFGSLSVLQCTFSGNTAGGVGGAIDNYLGQVTFTNSILANNSSQDFYNWSGSSTVTFAGTNIVTMFSNVSGGTAITNGGIISANPLLGPLANNGGQTRTMMPQIGSPAIDGGVTADAAGIAYDQRGPGFPRVVSPAVDLGAVEMPRPNAVLINADSGYGSLRYLATYFPSNITFAPALAGQTITLTSEIALSNSVTIDASALAGGIWINGNHNSRIFNVAGGTTVTLNSLTITNGYVIGDSGGGIQNGGTLTLSNCTLAGNSTDGSGLGGAINNFGTLTLSGCTLAGNAASFAGAIQNIASCSLVNCTLANNTAAPYNGGAIHHEFGSLSVLQCTFSGNTAGGVGGAIDNYLGQVTFTNSILANNSSEDFYNWSGSSTVTFAGTNIVTTFSNVSGGTAITNGGIISANPLLGPLASNGGPTPTMMPQTNSPAINAGATSDAAGLAYDQRGPGFPRVIGLAVDIGAVEVPWYVAPFVFNTADSGPGSLRYVSAYTTNGATITFTPALAGQTITLTSGAILVGLNVAIDGSPLASPLAINGNSNSSVFIISTVNVTLNSLVITNGSGTGGGILNFGQPLIMNNCTVSGNHGSGGGGIDNQGLLQLTSCTLSGNSGTSAGGIYNLGLASLTNCTLANNTSSGGAGAIYNYNGGIVEMMLQCTVSSNSSSAPPLNAAVVNYYNGTMSLADTIVANNSGGDIDTFFNSTITFYDANIVLVHDYDATGYEYSYGGIISLDPMLGPLANNGGSTQTMMPRPGSPAINTGLNIAVPSIAYDQRGPGFPRVVGPVVDIGSVEAQGILAQSPPLITGTVLTNGRFGFNFTNSSGASFNVYATTNLSLPFSNWANLGAAVESPLGTGQYHFTDSQATNSARRFYIVLSP
jgi:hypothetical protein